MANLLYIEVNNTLQTLVLEELPLSGDVIIIPRDQVGLHKDLSVPVRIDESGKVTVCSLNLGDEYSGGDKVEVRNKKDIITTPVEFADNVYYDVTVYGDEGSVFYRMSKSELSKVDSNANLFQLPKGTVNLGESNVNHVIFHKKNISEPVLFAIEYSGGTYSVCSKQNNIAVYVNGYAVKKQVLEYGDIVHCYGTRLIFLGDCILLYGSCRQIGLQRVNYEVVKQKIADESQATHYRHKVYSSNPRIVDSVDTTPISIDAPPRPEQLKKVPVLLQIGPSLTMALAMVVTLGMSVSSFVRGGGMASIITSGAMCLAMLMGALLWPMLTRRYQKKQHEENERLRNRRYTAYLDRKEAQIQARNVSNKKILESLYWPPETVMENLDKETEIHNYMFNKLSGDPDFLCVRLGTANLPNIFPIESPAESFTLFDDPLMQRAVDLQKKYLIVDNMPLVLDLRKHRSMGIVGPNRYDILQSLILSLTISHSYEDVKCAFICNTADSGKYQWCKNLSHAHSNEGDTMYVACNAVETHQLLCEIAKNLEAEEEDTGKEYAKQHYVIFVFGKELIENESLKNRFANVDIPLAITLVYVGQDVTDLPSECSATIYHEDDVDHLYLKIDGRSSKINFTPDTVDDKNFIKYVQKLSTYRLNVRTKAVGIPTSTSFLDMFKVGNVRQLNIRKRWEENDASRSMATPIGIGAGGELLYLDMHETAHGPHGLVAGMTGSGKSEMLQSMILSLAVNYHPDDVSFIIVDFKGGGMAEALAGLPHIAGKITNLSGAELTRAMISIDAEMKRRQVEFQKAGKISSLDKYMHLRKTTRPDLKPLPHMIIIIDEFAQLKAQHPEFMRKLIDVAQIGRSLGFHLILATQKPSGIVDDQIWGNSRFRLCMKVLQKQDSMDLIRRPDAARIKIPGRTYLQVGYDEVFDCFQSGYSGTTYLDSDVYHASGANVVSLIDSMGNTIESRQVLSEKEQANKASKLTQLAAIIKHIAEESAGIHPHTIWWDPLPGLLSYEEIEGKRCLFDGRAWKTNKGLSVAVGKIDNTANQKQDPYYVDLEKGNLGIYGCSGSGKTILVQTMLYGLCMKYSPAELRMHIFDFGTRSLGVFDHIPHIIGRTVYSDDELGVAEKVQQILKLLERRKELFGQHRVPNLEAYNKKTDQKLPAILIVVDNYSVVNECFSQASGASTSLGTLLTKVAREGQGSGVYCIFTGMNKSAIYFRTADFVSQNICFKMTDMNGYREVLKMPLNFEIADCRGRGVCVVDKAVVEFQAAIVGKLQDDSARIAEIEAKGKQMRGVMPASYTSDVMEEDVLRLQPLDDGIHIGNTMNGETAIISYKNKNACCILGPEEESQSLYSYVNRVVDAAKQSVKHFYCFDPKKRREDSISKDDIESAIRQIAKLPQSDSKMIVILDMWDFVKVPITDEADSLFKNLMDARKENNAFFIVADTMEHFSYWNANFTMFQESGVLMYVGNNLRKQSLCALNKIPKYDESQRFKLSGYVYDYQTDTCVLLNW